METPDIEKLKYPIGKFDPATMGNEQYLERAIFAIEAFPIKLQNTVNQLDDAQLDTPYRPGGWTVRQLVHHIPDSHMNGYFRFKWTLTENNPAVKPYIRDKWAALPDSKSPVYVAFNLLSSLHEKWVLLMKSLKEEDWESTFLHPETQQPVPLKHALGVYAWHGDHHLAHIKGLISREGW